MRFSKLASWTPNLLVSVDRRKILKLEVQGQSILQDVGLSHWCRSHALHTHRFASGLIEVENCWPSSDLSHSIRAMESSQVSRTTRAESERYFVRTGIEDGEEIAPIP